LRAANKLLFLYKEGKRMTLDEKRFLIDIYNAKDKTPRHILEQGKFYFYYKRAMGILGKWSDKGWYEYGVALDLGWLTNKGKAEALKRLEG
jgi:hypothetical protein